MKSFIIFSLVSSLCLCFTGAPLAVSAEEFMSRHMPTGKVLEFSLSRLKESVEKIMEKNDRMAFENEMLRKSVSDLQTEKKFLAGKKEALSQGMSVSDYEEKRSRSIKTVDIAARERRVEELSNIFREDIQRVKGELRVLEDGLSRRELGAYRKTFSEEAQKNEKALIQAEKKLKSLQQANKGPVRKISALKQEQNTLVREIQSLEYRLRGF